MNHSHMDAIDARCTYVKPMPSWHVFIPLQCHDKTDSEHEADDPIFWAKIRRARGLQPYGAPACSQHFGPQET